jgi:hypothetical protein
MYLRMNDTTGESVILGEGSTLVRYHRSGLTLKPPDAHYRPGWTALEEHLRNATTFPDELGVEFVHTGQVHRYVRS